MTEEYLLSPAGMALADADAALDVFKPHVSGAALGNLVLPQFAPGMGLVLEYARLRLLQAALLDGNDAIAGALASPAGSQPPAVVPVQPQALNGSGLLLPGQG